MTKEDKFRLSKRIKDKLKHADHIKKEIVSGKSIQEILEISDEIMASYYQSATHLLENKKYADAANAFLFLATLDPRAHEYWLGLGMATQMSHDYEAAIDAYEIAAICQIENPLPYFYLAKCLFAIHDRESTLQALELTIEYADDIDEFADLKRQAKEARTILLKDYRS